MTKFIGNRIKVKRGCIGAVRNIVTDHKFYKQENHIKRDLLETMIQKITEIYEVDQPSLTLNPTRGNCYYPHRKEISIMSYSIISMLHELRHHLQHSGIQNQDLTIEQDARAFSLRIFSKACPKSFKKSVQANRVHHVKWDYTINQVVDDATYI